MEYTKRYDTLVERDTAILDAEVKGHVMLHDNHILGPDGALDHGEIISAAVDPRPVIQPGEKPWKALDARIKALEDRYETA